jgi:hypothetical protein
MVEYYKQYTISARIYGVSAIPDRAPEKKYKSSSVFAVY